MSSKKRSAGRQVAGAPSSDPRKQGMRAFSANSFDSAIALWSKLDHKNDKQVRTALAEAYFRRALSEPEPAQRVRNLQQARSFAPSDMRYQYHLGLALHQSGDIEGATKAYQTVLENSLRWAGVGMVLALAELARNPQVDLASLPGSSPQARDRLAPVQALLQGETPAPADGDALQTLWHGLGLLRSDSRRAHEILSDTSPLPSTQAAAVRLFYRGVAAYQQEQRTQALQDWLQVLEHESYQPVKLNDNLAAVLIEQLQAHLEAENIAEASTIAQQVTRQGVRHNALNPLLVQALDQGAQQAAREGEWQQAVLLWEDARQLVGSSSTLGSPRLLLHNLALAYEILEEWTAAAEMWRAMMRTRPRKAKSEEEKAADPQDYTDAQWAWIRKRVITCYQHAGEPGEAVKVFRQAIKSDPDDLDMRIQLADSLLANNQAQASINELNRILEREPRHVDAHLRLAEIYVQISDEFDWRGQWHVAERSLRIVLEEEPDREDVRRQVSRILLTRGHRLHSMGNRIGFPSLLEDAERVFQEGQEFDPNEYQFPLNLARVAVDKGETDKVEPLLERALELAGDYPRAYIFVIECWGVAKCIDKAREVLERARQELSPTVDFYVELAGALLASSTPPPPPLFGFFNEPPPPPEPPGEDWVALAEEAIAQAVALQPDNPQVRLKLASTLLSLNPELAQQQAEAAVQLQPEEPASLLLLGILQGVNQKVKEAKATLRKAARLARKQGLYDLAEQAEAMRQEVGSPFFRMSLQMGSAFDDLDDEEYY